MKFENKQNAASGFQGSRRSSISLVDIDVFPSTCPRRANIEQVSSSSVVSGLTTVPSNNEACATVTGLIPLEHPKPEYGYDRFQNIELSLHEEHHFQGQRRLSASAPVQAPQVEFCLLPPPVCLDGVTNSSGSSVPHYGGNGTNVGPLHGGTGEQNYAEKLGTGSVHIDEPVFNFFSLCDLPQENSTPAYVCSPNCSDYTGLLKSGEGNWSQPCLQEGDIQALELAIKGEVEWSQCTLDTEDEEAFEKTMEWIRAEGW